MNEKQIQEIMARVDEFGNSRRRQGNDEYSPESGVRRYSAQYGRDADETRAAIESALREQVPEGWKLVPVEPTPKMVDATWNDPIELVGGCESHNTRNKRIYRAMLSASPQAPNHTEHILGMVQAPQPACWCETCDLAQGNPMGRTRMSTCPQCGDKRCQRAKHHDNACSAQPAQPDRTEQTR